MALSVPNNATANFAVVSSEQLLTPTPGNWLVAVLTLKVTDGSNPQISVGDYARNLWTLVYSGMVTAAANNSSAQLQTQVWVAPAVQYAGWPSLGVYAYAIYASALDVATGVLNVFEVAGMTSGFLTVDSVTTATASSATSLAITLPAPTGGADCLMVGAAGTDNAAGNTTVTSAGWTSVTQAADTSPNAVVTAAWREATASQTIAWNSTVSTNWAAVAVAIRVTGVAAAQPNSHWPPLEFQLGLGQNLSTPISAVQWTTLPNRLMQFDTQRGIQYELGFVQSSPTDLTLRNDDGALSPRTGGSGTAVANGTTTTLVVSNSSGATITVGDFFQLKSGGALKEVNVFQVTGISIGTNTTITYARADGTGGGSAAGTATGDVYSPCPIDVYIPYRILATWNGVRYPVAVGWIERWPQYWDDPHWGYVQAVGIDVIATLTAADQFVLRGEILRRNPQSYWPLGDAAGVGTAQNVSGVGTTVLTVTQSSNGSGTNATQQFGASTQKIATNASAGSVPYATIVGDSGTGWQTTGSTAAELATKGWALVGSPGNDTTFPSITNGVTILGVHLINLTDYNNLSSMTSDPTVFAIRSSSGTGGLATRIKLSIGSGATNTKRFKITTWDKTTGTGTVTTSSLLTDGGLFTFWAVTFNQTSWQLYVGDITGLSSGGSGTANMNTSFGLINIGGEADSTTNGFYLNWTALAHVAIFSRQLTQGELTDINNAVTSAVYAYAGTNDSINRKLAFVNWRGARVLNYTSVLDGTDIPASTIAEKAATLADYEGGRLFSDAAGQLQFRAAARASNQTSRVTLGDRPDLGEIPFVGGSSDLEIDFDPTYIYNNVTVTNLNPVTGYGDTGSSQYVAVNQTSAARYGTRTLGKQTSLKNGSDASNLANSLLSKYAFPSLRLASVTIDAVAAGGTVAAIWPFVLGVEVGDVVTVNRRPIGAPAISFTCVVLNITHTVDPPNKWELKLILVPR